MRTTLKQIAEQTHLSVSIVSQVLNGKECRVSKENRALILRTAEEMDYRRNMMAVSLVKGSANMIGLAISDIRNDFFASIAKGIEGECQRNAWNVILCNSNDRHETDMRNLRMLGDVGVSGIVWGMASDSTDAMAQEGIDFMTKAKIPYLLVDRYINTNTGGIICVDHVKGGYLAAEYLLKRGHKKIVCITGPSNLIDSRQRLQGVKKALEKFKPDSECIVIGGKYTYQSGFDAAEEIISRRIKADAIFAFNDMMAIGAMTKLREAGIRIPEDISVIGYDDIFMDEFLEVPLTTIKQPTEKMGKCAAHNLIHGKINYKDNNQRIVFSPELIERETVIDRH